MPVHAYYNPQNHGPYEHYALGDLLLISGQTLRDCELAVATYGQLNAAKDNAILIPTWYSGTSRIIHDVFVGSGRPIDPEKYFIIIVNQLGSGLSSSPHNTAEPQARGRFPAIAVADDVSAQERLVTEVFGVNQLALVMGGSMGAQQAYEWAVRFPARVRRLAAIAGTARTSEVNQLIAEAILHSLRSDPAFCAGDYRSASDLSAGLVQHARLMTLHGLSPAFFEQQHYRALGFNSVAAFVEGFMTPYFAPMDPNALITQLEKWRTADAGHLCNGDLPAALARITARTLVLPIQQDLYFPPAACEADARLIKGAHYQALSCPYGHLGLFAMDAQWLAQVDEALRALLDE
ncbi:alpha/beta fold hydrolase [Pseudomonas sp. dw_358]|uniref:alpha/beta fold hydrolase n=1 Tax=Pseudomonas sp. dw_358 TaxID=2720083 RepID=UPI001C4A528A|nr:alpha/beta fold hydrolase [Pseudomonas sp. dw_358]